MINCYECGDLATPLSKRSRCANCEYRRCVVNENENAKLREALTKLRDCDWVVSLPDRMDAVRDIARTALSSQVEEV